MDPICNSEVESVHAEIVTLERREDGAVVRKTKQVLVVDPKMFSINQFRPDPMRGGKRVFLSLSGVCVGQQSEVVTDNEHLLPKIDQT